MFIDSHDEKVRGSFNCHSTRVRAETIANSPSKREEKEELGFHADPKISVKTATIARIVRPSVCLRKFSHKSLRLSLWKYSGFSSPTRSPRSRISLQSSIFGKRRSSSIFARHHIISANVFSCASRTRRRRRRRRLAARDTYTSNPPEFNDWHRKGTPPSYARYTHTIMIHPRAHAGDYAKIVTVGFPLRESRK